MIKINRKTLAGLALLSGVYLLSLSGLAQEPPGNPPASPQQASIKEVCDAGDDPATPGALFFYASWYSYPTPPTCNYLAITEGSSTWAPDQCVDSNTLKEITFKDIAGYSCVPSSYVIPAPNTINPAFVRNVNCTEWCEEEYPEHAGSITGECVEASCTHPAGNSYVSDVPEISTHASFSVDSAKCQCQVQTGGTE